MPVKRRPRRSPWPKRLLLRLEDGPELAANPTANVVPNRPEDDAPNTRVPEMRSGTGAVNYHTGKGVALTQKRKHHSEVAELWSRSWRGARQRHRRVG